MPHGLLESTGKNLFFRARLCVTALRLHASAASISAFTLVQAAACSADQPLGHAAALPDELQHLLLIIGCVVQLLLLTKCIVIAVLGEDNMWPSLQYNIGLFYMFLPTVTGIIMCNIEYFAATAVVEGALGMTELAGREKSENHRKPRSQGSHDSASTRSLQHNTIHCEILNR